MQDKDSEVLNYQRKRRKRNHENPIQYHTDCGRMDRSVHDIGCGAICEDDVAGT